MAHRSQNQWGKVAGVLTARLKKKNPGVEIAHRNCREYTDLLMDHHRDSTVLGYKVHSAMSLL